MRRPIDPSGLRPATPGAELVVPAFAPHAAVFTWRNLNRRLPQALCRLRHEDQPFRPAQDLGRLVEPVVAALSARGAKLFDGAGVRLASDLTVDVVDAPKTGVVVQPVSYFDGLVTNHLAFRGVQTAGGTVDPTPRFFEDGRLLGLRRSPAANRIGADCLAVTADGLLVLTRQAGGSVTSPETWAPSGSGGMEPCDTTSGDLFDAARSVMRRELAEECGLEQSMVSQVTPIAYARDLAYGGKPKFFGLARLEVEFAELATRDAERQLVGGHHPVEVDLSSPGALSGSLRACLAELGQLSAPLAVFPALLDHHSGTNVLADLFS